MIVNIKVMQTRKLEKEKKPGRNWNTGASAAQRGYAGKIPGLSMVFLTVTFATTLI
jgi:hypothetical protein